MLLLLLGYYFNGLQTYYIRYWVKTMLLVTTGDTTGDSTLWLNYDYNHGCIKIITDLGKNSDTTSIRMFVLAGVVAKATVTHGRHQPQPCVRGGDGGSTGDFLFEKAARGRCKSHPFITHVLLLSSIY